MKLVLAVPMTYEDIAEQPFYVSVMKEDVRSFAAALHPLSTKRHLRMIKAGNLRHFSIERVDPIVGLLTNRAVIIRVHDEILKAVGL